MKKPTLLQLFLCAVLAAGCRHAEREGAETPGDGTVEKGAPARSDSGNGRGTARILHANGFRLSQLADTTLITVFKPWQGATADFTYKLVDSTRGADKAQAVASPPSASLASASLAGSQVLHIPMHRVVTLTTTNLRDFETVGVLDALVGLGGGRYVCNPEIRARLASGRIRDVGEDVRLDLETLMSLRPNAIFTYVVGSSSDGGLAKLGETGIPAVIEGSYMEETPLGRAEWIKFTAAFFGKGAQADSAFAEVERSYSALVELAKKAARKPKVVVGAPFGGIWWVPSGRTYVGRLLADAGADYPWAADTTRGSLSLDVEAVLGRDGDADVWLNAGDWKDLADAKAKDPRNALFKAWKDGRVYANDAFLCEGGGRDFYETGASRPDLILADLIAILHPELLPGHKLRWYRKLPGPG